MKIPCRRCKMMLDSVFELKVHRFETHYDHYLKKADGDEKILLRNVGELKK